eukprot:CAMPEP_0184716288 /NCGR_PEP_ID=MMETSP0314-20130426/6047_1 /TAXON_ID=38298 /ORGANISM="Rhodella maculata, Strain CCMP 736" /LENGTH=39 /DNA_ID= /DNA_START= /DNA_END= /DNA_ORIENTATION=
MTLAWTSMARWTKVDEDGTWLMPRDGRPVGDRGGGKGEG